MGLVAVVLVGISVAARVFAGVAGGILLLGACYAGILVVDDPPLDGRAAFLGTALLVVGELASLSLSARARVTSEAGGTASRVARVAVLGLAAAVLGGAVLAVVDLLRASGTLVEVVGVAAALAAVGLLALAARAARTEPPA